MTFSCVLVTYSYDWSSNPFRDLVHRQTACAAIKHMALGVSGFGCEDALTHLMNYVWPNIFETSPHVVNAVMESIEGMRVALGPSKVLQYCLQVRGYKTLCYAIILLGFSPSKFLFLTWVESVYYYQSFLLHHVKRVLFISINFTSSMSCYVALHVVACREFCDGLKSLKKTFHRTFLSLHFPGNVSSGAKGSRCLLEDLQQLVYWITGKTVTNVYSYHISSSVLVVFSFMCYSEVLPISPLFVSF